MSIIATPQNAVVCHIHFVELLRFNACVITKPYVEISSGDKYRWRQGKPFLNKIAKTFI